MAYVGLAQSQQDMEKLVIQAIAQGVPDTRLKGLLAPHLDGLTSDTVTKLRKLRYDCASIGAVLFERLYDDILARVFGDGLFGRKAWNAIRRQTSAIADYYHFFDRALLGDDPNWFGEEGREAALRAAIAKQLDTIDAEPTETWGHRQQFVMRHIVLGGRLPRWLGFDRGPFELPGCRATIVQGGIFDSHGRQTTFCDSREVSSHSRFVLNTRDNHSRMSSDITNLRTKEPAPLHPHIVRVSGLLAAILSLSI
jgi:penicillin amidase